MNKNNIKMYTKENTTPLKNLLKNVISGIEKKRKDEGDIVNLWEKTVGKKASRHTKPAFLKEGRFVVNVSNSSWLYNLTIEKRTLLQKLNRSLKKEKKVKTLQFRIQKITKKPK